MAGASSDSDAADFGGVLILLKQEAKSAMSCNWQLSMLWRRSVWPGTALCSLAQPGRAFSSPRLGARQTQSVRPLVRRVLGTVVADGMIGLNSDSRVTLLDTKWAIVC